MNTKYKIIISISFCILLLISLCINIFAVSNSYSNKDDIDMYLYRYHTTENIGSYTTLYYSIYTNHQKLDNWVSDVSGLSFKNYQNLTKDYYLNNIFMNVDYNIAITLNMILRYFNINDNNIKLINEATSHESKLFNTLGFDIDYLLQAGYYFQTYSPDYNTTPATFELFVDAVNNRDVRINNYYNLHFYKFITDLCSAIAYVYNEESNEDEYNTPVVSMIISEDLYNMFCSSIYNIIHYE